jgi:hypothetical protein
MDANDLTPEHTDTLAHGLRDPVIWETLDFIGPLNLESTLRVVRDLERVRQRRPHGIRILSQLRGALSRPGVLDRLRARRADAWARHLLLTAYRLGVGDSPR